MDKFISASVLKYFSSFQRGRVYDVREIGGYIGRKLFHLFLQLGISELLFFLLMFWLLEDISVSKRGVRYAYGHFPFTLLLSVRNGMFY